LINQPADNAGFFMAAIFDKQDQIQRSNERNLTTRLRKYPPDKITASA
jgi:hypothetical protein